MNLPPALIKIQQLHDTYCRLTGLAVPLNPAREYTWAQFLQAGYGLPQLQAVIHHIQRGIKHGRGYTLGTLKYSRLIEALDTFEEHLAEARVEHRAKLARARAPKPHPAAQVLRATGRDPATPAHPPRQAGDVAAQITRNPEAAAKALAELKALAQSL